MSDWKTRQKGSAKQKGKRFKTSRGHVKGTSKSQNYKPESSEREKLIKNAVKFFGIAKDSSVAGFILPDGRLLDISIKGSKTDKFTEHSEVGFIIPEIHKNIPPFIYFAQKTGSIRLRIYGNQINIQFFTENKPTEQQWRTINKTVKQHPDAKVFYDIEGKITPENYPNAYPLTSGEIKSENNALTQEIISKELNRFG